MAGRTTDQADKALGLYKGTSATPVAETWISLFTTNPTADHPTSHGGVEWGPPRVRVYPNLAAGSPYWSDASDLSATERFITNAGSISFPTITLTTSPSTVVGVGVFDASTGGNLRTWDELTTDVVVADGESHTFGTGNLKIRSE